MYLSADMTVRKIELVNWLIDVVVMYTLHMTLPKIQFSLAIVAIKNGMPTRKHSSAMARFKMYMFVTVCILEYL